MKYYNSTRGPLSVPLQDGRSLIVRPKAWSSDILPDNEGSPELLRLVSRGYLRRSTRVEEPIAPIVEETVEIQQPAIAPDSEPAKGTGSKRRGRK